MGTESNSSLEETDLGFGGGLARHKQEHAAIDKGRKCPVCKGPLINYVCAEDGELAVDRGQWFSPPRDTP
jgi:hypothetical protein